MKQTNALISTYSADTFGVCSALFELGGMVIMHDASGCNGTYTTHDEPRWFDMDSMVYISALSELEAILGDDEKLIADIAAAAAELQPKFIAIAGTPIPTMTGFDYDAVAELVQRRTSIPTFGFPSTGMNTYIHGASLAFARLAKQAVLPATERTPDPTANILGLTPLDFSTNGQDTSIARWLEGQGFRVLSRWAMGSTLEDIAQAGMAHRNLVVSQSGLEAAKLLQRRFGTPYTVGIPIGGSIQPSDLPGGDTVIIGEAVYSLSLAWAIERRTGTGVRVICPTADARELLRDKDLCLSDETAIQAAIANARAVIADPLYRPICPREARFIPLPAESFSGRIFRNQIPDPVRDPEQLIKELSL